MGKVTKGLEKGGKGRRYEMDHFFVETKIVNAVKGRDVYSYECTEALHSNNSHVALAYTV
jgi:hypothetical protein